MLTPIESKPVYYLSDVENEILKIINKNGNKITSSDIWDIWTDTFDFDTTKTLYFSLIDDIDDAYEFREELINGLKELQEQLGNPDSIQIHYSW